MDVLALVEEEQEEHVVDGDRYAVRPARRRVDAHEDLVGLAVHGPGLGDARVVVKAVRTDRGVVRVPPCELHGNVVEDVGAESAVGIRAGGAQRPWKIVQEAVQRPALDGLGRGKLRQLHAGFPDQVLGDVLRLGVAEELRELARRAAPVDVLLRDLPLVERFPDLGRHRHLGLVVGLHLGRDVLGRRLGPGLFAATTGHQRQYGQRCRQPCVLVVHGMQVLTCRR